MFQRVQGLFELIYLSVSSAGLFLKLIEVSLMLFKFLGHLFAMSLQSLALILKLAYILYLHSELSIFLINFLLRLLDLRLQLRQPCLMLTLIFLPPLIKLIDHLLSLIDLQGRHLLQLLNSAFGFIFKPFDLFLCALFHLLYLLLLRFDYVVLLAYLSGNV